MRRQLSSLFFILCSLLIASSQTVQDDFEGNGNITSWFGDDCGLNAQFANPFKNSINNSSTVLQYSDNGGQYANIRFDVVKNFELSSNYIFTIKIYIPTSGLTGNQNNQVSLKLQDGNLGQPWVTQSEIIKNVTLDKWQTVTFNFNNDPYINLDGNSPPPTQRKDFNRVVIQVNGENNNSKVVAYIDDLFYDGIIVPDPVYDKLVWSDEFNINGPIDNAKWFHQTKLPINGSWYNGEIQHYTNRSSNSYAADGFLNIMAKKESFSDQGYTKQYTSARLNSKFSFKYGKIEFRAKLPFGVGTWPAFWMLGKNIDENGAYWDNLGFGTKPWPACGEIDIMEHWGHNQNYISSAIHTPSSFGNTVNVGGRSIPAVSTEFHVYTLVWTPEKLVFSVDSVIHYIYRPTIRDEKTWPFEAEQYILLNVAIQPGISQGFVQSPMVVDYVRVYQEQNVSGTTDAKTATIFYPNPVIDRLNIKLENISGKNAAVRIHDLSGKVVYSNIHLIDGNTLVLNKIGFLDKGAYVLIYTVGEISRSLKFIKI